MRLIDADKLLEELRKDHPTIYGIFYDIKYSPTAYDVDKVIDELMEKYYSCDLTKTDGSEYEDGRFDAYNDAIEIVKRGGVQE